MARNNSRQSKSDSAALRAKPAEGAGGGSATSLPRCQRKQPEDPWMKWAGMFKDDPMYLPMMKEIYKERAGGYEE
ncbi:MAG: hypothetical protein HY318_04690 [Armatimonadetes bacterium]|nr:hypothetical protein [Armatimonadota bacterium]